MTIPIPEHPVFPTDLDLTEATDYCTHLTRIALANPHLTEAERAADIIGALLAEVYTTRRDRDSARHTILSVSRLVPRWRTLYNADGPDNPREFARGLGAAADTLAEVLARQMIRD